MKSETVINLDLYNENYEVVNAKQYDCDSRVLIINVLAHGKKIEIPDTITARIKIKKPDGKGILDNCTVEDGQVKVLLKEQMLTAAGKCRPEIILSENGEIISTMSFPLDIKSSSLKNEDIVSTPEFDALTEALKKADEYNEEIGSASAAADTAKSYAVGGTGTRENEDTDNAKYYYEMSREASETAVTAKTDAVDAKNDAETAKDTAVQSASEAETSATSARESKEAAEQSKTTASGKAEIASTAADTAKSYAVGGTGTRENEDVDNAKYYKEQAENITIGLQGGLIPMGTIAYASLAVVDKHAGYMYNISDEFTTDDTFKDGAGYTYPAGTNVYYTADGYWDALAGTMVSGVKGEAESSFRKGNVVITKESIGLENVQNVAVNDMAPEYTELDEVAELTSGEKISIAFGKIAKFIKSGLERFTKIESDISDINSSLLKYLPIYYIVSATAGTTTEIPIEYNNLHMYRVTVGESGTYGGISDKYGQYLLSEGSSFIVQASTAVEAISESLDSSKILITWKTSSYKTVIVEKLDR